MTDNLANLLSQDEPTSPKSSTSEKFKPNFNVREDFVLWINNQFPELNNHSESDTSYPELLERKEEVYKAAGRAFNHIEKSTQHCTLESSERYWKRIKKSYRENEDQIFIISVDSLVRSITNFSLSLGGDPYFSNIYNSSDEPLNTKFTPDKNPRYDFKNWVY